MASIHHCLGLNMPSPFDTVIRHADIATASDRYTADIGILNGQIVAIGQNLSPGQHNIDAQEIGRAHV